MEEIAKPVLQMHTSSNDDTTIDKTNKTLARETPVCFPKSSVDVGDDWVQKQQLNFSKSNYNYNNEVLNLLEEEDSMSDDVEEKLSEASVKESAIKNDKVPNVSIRRHRKKSKKQLEILESYFDPKKEWSLSLVEELAAKLELEKDQVYKWNWDKRKRMKKKLAKLAKSNSVQKKSKRQKTS